MTVKDKGVTIWTGLPHPAQDKWSATIDVVADETFWRRVEKHVESDPQSWRSLTWPSSGIPGEGRGESLRDNLRNALFAALQHPAIMARQDLSTDTVTWHVILREGACLVLRFDTERAYAEDCFFIDAALRVHDPRDRRSHRSHRRH